MNCIKSNKGFSLVEILVAVSIIGIISAIAIPAFQDYREQASKVAGDTSIGNVGRAYQNCMVLKQFGSCDSLSDLGITCPDCTSDNDGTDQFCAQIKKQIGGEEFRACVGYKGNDFVKRSYGGSLLKDVKICKNRVTGCTGANAATDNVDHPQPGAKECEQPSDCSQGSYSCTSSGSANVVAACEPVGTGANIGSCDGSGVCR